MEGSGAAPPAAPAPAAGGSAAVSALDGLAQLQEMLKGARGATPEQRAAGPPAAMMEMMRAMGQHQQEMRAAAAPEPLPEPVLAVAAPLPPAPAPAPAEKPAPQVPAPVVAPPAPADPQLDGGAPRWSAQTTWEMGSEDGSGLRLAICEDDATEEAEIAEGRLEAQTVPQLTTLRPGLPPAYDSGAARAVPPCDLLLQASPAAAIVRATVVSTVGTIELFLTAPHSTREDYVQSCHGKGLESLGEGYVGERWFAAECGVKRWCERLRLRLLGPGSAITKVGLGRVVLRIDTSVQPPPPSQAADAAAAAMSGEGPAAGGGKLDMSKVEVGTRTPHHNLISRCVSERRLVLAGAAGRCCAVGRVAETV